MSDAKSIGQNVRTARRYRGMSLETLAGLIGKSKGWLSAIENGHIRLDKRSDIAAIVEVLRVSATDILGGPSPIIEPRQRDEGDAVRLREALMENGIDDPLRSEARPLDVLRAELDEVVIPARIRADYVTMSRALGGLLDEAHVHAASGKDRAAGLRLLVDLCSHTTTALGHLGQADLKWIAAERAHQAARLLDEPVALGIAASARAHARPSATRSRALLLAHTAADQLEPHLGDDRLAHEVYGMLRLSSALACQVNGDRSGAMEHVSEAARIADRLGDSAHAWNSFGPANVGVWRVMLAVEDDSPDAAVQHAQRINRRALPARSRRAALAVETGHAYLMLERPHQATRELLTAEKLSPAHIHHNALVKELVRDMVDRGLANAELRGLAWRLGVI